MTVFIVQDTRRYDRTTGEYVSVHDVTPAREYGELHYLLSPTAAPWSTETIIADLYRELDDFGDEDFLLMIGNPALIGLATAVAADINGGKIKFLQWHGKDRKYYPVDAKIYEYAPD